MRKHLAAKTIFELLLLSNCMFLDLTLNLLPASPPPSACEISSSQHYYIEPNLKTRLNFVAPSVDNWFPSWTISKHQNVESFLSFISGTIFFPGWELMYPTRFDILLFYIYSLVLSLSFTPLPFSRNPWAVNRYRFNLCTHISSHLKFIQLIPFQ